MEASCTYIPYNETGFFSKLVTDYLAGDEGLSGLYDFRPDFEGIGAAISAREHYPVDRNVLVTTLQKQYSSLPASEAVSRNIELLLQENTFTVCTAHQPNLLTGYLYFVYKIIHAIKLAEDLNAKYVDKHFVPVYYMGSEDNDLDELGTFRYEGKKYKWDAAGQTGAVGRMDTKSLEPLLNELFKVLGPPGDNTDDLKKLLTEAYLQHKTISEATQYLVHQLFGRFGLVVLNPDEAAFKQSIVAIIKDDLLTHTPYNIVTANAGKLEHYKLQAFPRPINLFYLEGQIRERIEKQDDSWVVLNTGISFTEQQLLDELEKHPERFSPNVILRGLLQESILPDVAFIGGGAEVAYWLQLPALFKHYHVFYPAILLRQSALWIKPQQAKQQKQLELTIPELFKPELELVHAYIAANSNGAWQTNGEMKAMEDVLAQLKEKATSLDPTLRGASEAVATKIKYQLTVLEKKMLRAEKRKMSDQLARVSKLKEALFPSASLQERYENFTGYYLQYGPQWFDMLKEATLPLGNQFLVVEAGR